MTGIILQFKKRYDDIKYFIKLFLRKHFNVGRSKELDSIICVNDNTYFMKMYPKLQRYLDKCHPGIWYDDEISSLFFAIYNYITVIEKMKLTVQTEGNYYRIILNGNNNFAYMNEDSKIGCILYLYRTKHEY